jgi:hypothetical protein
MIRTVFRYVILSLLVVLAAGCAGHTSSEKTGKTAAALTLQGRPLPANLNGSQANAWSGSPVDLLVADAFASCSYPAINGVNGTWEFFDANGLDEYLKQVYVWMGSAQCTDTANPSPLANILSSDVLHYWFVQRGVESVPGWHNDCNTDGTLNAVTGAPNPALATLQPTPVADDLPDETTITLDYTQQTDGITAGALLRKASVNACIARQLRQMSPGSTGGEALLYSADEQRKMLQVIVERTRIAMLQYAALSILFTTPQPSPPPSGGSIPALPLLQQWAADPDNAATLGEMADDFAYSVNLNIQATGEMVSLLGRSAGAHSPRGGNPANAQDEMWGYESWRDRALALLYGGDPLVRNADQSAPWAHTLDQSDLFPGYPGVINPFGPSDQGYRDWPDAPSARYPAQPFVATDVTEPQVNQFEELARRYDAMHLKQNSAFVMAGAGNATPDPDASATWIYMQVEAGLRTSNCDGVFNGACQVFQVSDIPVPNGMDAAHSYQSFDLWTQHRISPDHAKLVARRLADYIGSYFGAPGASFDFPGAMNMNGVGSIVSHPDESGGAPTSWYRIPPDATFHDKKVSQLAGLYTHLGRYYMPDHIDPTVTLISGSGQGQGLNVDGSDQESARRMGSVSALAAVRYALWTAYQNGPTSPTSSILAKRPNILKLIDGAIGAGGFSIHAAVQTVFPAGESVVSQNSPNPGVYTWRATVTTASDDAWWNISGATYSLLAVPNAGGWAGNIVLFPKTVSFGQGQTISSLVNQATTATLLQNPQAPADAPGTVFRDYSIDLPGDADNWLFFAVRTASDGSQQYALLGANVTLVTATITNPSGNAQLNVPLDGQFIAFNGQLTQYERQVMDKDSFNLAQPAFDGFGMPMRWSPPSNPALFNGSQGQSAVQYYLSQAQMAGQDATNQVKDAIQTLIQQQLDDKALAAAVAKGVRVSQLQLQSLCGTANPNCDTSVTDYTFPAKGIWNNFANSLSPAHRSYDRALSDCTGYPRLDFSNPQPFSEVQKRLDCVALSIFTIIPSRLRLATPIVNHAGDPQMPGFSDYQGGTYQKDLFAQWSALTSLTDSVRQLLMAEAAAEAQTSAASSVLENDQQDWNNVAQGRCSPTQLVLMNYEPSCHLSVNTSQTVTDVAGMITDGLSCLFSDCSGSPAQEECTLGETPRAKDSQSDQSVTWDDFQSQGTSQGESGGVSLGYGGAGINFGTNGGTSSSSVPVGQRRQMCRSILETFQAAQGQALAAMFEAYASLTDRTTTVVQEIGTLVQAEAEGAALAEQAKLAGATAELEAEQLASSQASTLKIYRQVHSYDVWRAQALLDAARIAAVTARRAIESHYAVDLSKLVANEPFVAAPTTWGDQVYQYDLSMASAVGLDLSTGLPDGVNPNAVADYVGNLNRFVNGFAVARPTAVDTDDLDVLTLPGPMGLVTSGGPPVGGDLGAQAAWTFQCPSATGTDTVWLPLPSDGNPNDACGSTASHPSAAQIAFSLDPWGRVNGDIAVDPFTKRYNSRWVQFALNVVGTGVLDCTQAADPNACYTQQFIRYQITQNGPSWVTDWNQSWMVLGVPIGQVEAGKALVAEQWLDPLQNNFSKPYVAAVARDEFADRPFGGEYQLVLTLGPEARLDRIQRLQILADYNYWVKQQ